MPDRHHGPQQGSSDEGAPALDHPNLVRGPFLRALATLQNANLARGACFTRIDFSQNPDRGGKTGEVALGITFMRTQDNRIRRDTAVVAMTEDTADLMDQLRDLGPWSQPTEPWFPLGIDPEPTDPLQIYTDLLYELGDHAAVLHEMYPGVNLILEEVTLSGERDATVSIASSDGVRYEVIMPLTDPASLVGIDFSLAEWAWGLAGKKATHDSPAEDRRVIRADWR